jgi:hypothetical protein
MAITEEQQQIINSLTREQCIQLLEWCDIQIYDNETIEELKEAVQSNYEDGTLDSEDIYLV